MTKIVTRKREDVQVGISDQLKEGVPFMVMVHFGTKWCKAFLELSGDENDTLHSKEGRRIVQGAAIFTKIGTLLSVHMKGYMVHQVNHLIFKKPVHIGESVSIIMRRHASRPIRTTVVVTIHNGSEEIGTAEIVLVSEMFLARSNRR